MDFKFVDKLFDLIESDTKLMMASWIIFSFTLPFLLYNWWPYSWLTFPILVFLGALTRMLFRLFVNPYFEGKKIIKFAEKNSDILISELEALSPEAKSILKSSLLVSVKHCSRLVNGSSTTLINSDKYSLEIRNFLTRNKFVTIWAKGYTIPLENLELLCKHLKIPIE
jgi:ABC-type antimicrobial peptide transport system permease subunit